MSLAPATTALLCGIFCALGCSASTADLPGANRSVVAADPRLSGLRVLFVGATFRDGEADLVDLITQQTGAPPGRIHAEGTPAAVAGDPHVIDAYLGTAHAA